MLAREKFRKFEEICLYIYAVLLFINDETIKFGAILLLVILILRKVLYKEGLECGDERLKKLLIFLVIGGTIWNFFGGMDYKPARNYLKLMRYMPIIFYVYPLMKKDKNIIYKFLISAIIGYFALFVEIFQQYSVDFDRATGFESINMSGLYGAIVSCVTMGLFLGEKNFYKKVFYLIISLSGIFITIATKGRGPLLSIVLVVIFLMIVFLFYMKINLREIGKNICALFILLFLFYKIIPEEDLKRFTTTFNTEKTVENASNGLRIEMWKNALWRIKKNPFFGSGTKYDKEKLFKQYVDNMPEENEVQKHYKRALRRFDDAHSMYLNAIVDNGTFVIVLFLVWFYAPFLALKYVKDSENKVLIVSLLGGMVSYEIQGLFWPIWRNAQQAIFWVLFTFILSLILIEKKELKSIDF